MPYQDEAKKVLQVFLGQLLKQEQKEFILLANQWGIISKNLDDLILKLANQENLSEDKLYRLALYKQFQQEAKVQIARYSNIAAGAISDQQLIYGKAGIETAQTLIGLKTQFFQKIPTEVINNFIGKSFYDGSKLNETLFARSYPEYMEKTKNILLNGIATGKNPRITAKLITKESTAPLWESLRLARTEQMMIYRESSVMQYERSGVCSGFERIEQPDCCDTCAPLNGKIYKFDEQYNDFHPNCRGAFLPVVG